MDKAKTKTVLQCAECRGVLADPAFCAFCAAQRADLLRSERGHLRGAPRAKNYCAG